MFKKKKEEEAIKPEVQNLDIGSKDIPPMKELSLEEVIASNTEAWFKAQLLQSLQVIYEELNKIREMEETSLK